MEVCGVDPGLHTTGYAFLSFQGQKVSICDAGICRTDKHASLAPRLYQIESDFTAVLEKWRPEVIGVEQLYSHYKHPRTAILMGHARGVILATAARFGVAVESYSATRVKRHLTGNGRASKHQVQRAVRATLALTSLPEPSDVADALAVALCCAHARPRRLLEQVQP